MVAAESICDEGDRILKILKRILYFILALIMLLCATILICAFNPTVTDRLTTIVGGEEQEVDTSVQIPNDESSDDNQGVYVPPAQEDVVSPEAVKDKNGYEPIRESGEQIADEDAESIQKELATGDTGEDISFDMEMYPYYGMLDSGMKTLYRQIYANAQELTTSFAPVVTVTVAQVRDVFEAVYNDHPELFWLETGYSCKHLENGQCVELTLQYYDIVADAEELEDAQERFDEAVRKMVTAANKLGSDYEKEKYVHDTLIKQVDYHAGTDMNQSAYSALVEGRSVCAGYARAFQHVLMELEIPCYYCMGYSGEDHAWNIVKLDDGYYNVDVTWDDTEPSTCDYFNKTDADYAKTHMRKGMSVYLPVCNGDDYRKGASPLSNMAESEEGEEGEMSTDSGSADADALINDNPQKPLLWEDTKDELQKAREELGLTEDEVMDTLDKYYADCLKQMKEVGSGKQQFTCIITKSLWTTIEEEYSDGSYKKGYVDAALKELGMKNFAIQLQTERINNTFYRLYHNVSTWNE